MNEQSEVQGDRKKIAQEKMRQLHYTATTEKELKQLSKKDDRLYYEEKDRA